MWKCPKCTEDVEDDFEDCWNCGTNKNGSPPENQFEFDAAKAEASESLEVVVEHSKTIGVVFTVIGLLLVVFGALRWDSTASQLLRAYDRTDFIGIVLFTIGGLALVAGLSPLVSSSVSKKSSHVTTSVEDRLRLLDELHSKQLISDSEYQQRRQDIVTSL